MIYQQTKGEKGINICGEENKIEFYNEIKHTNKKIKEEPAQIEPISNKQTSLHK